MVKLRLKATNDTRSKSFTKFDSSSGFSYVSLGVFTVPSTASGNWRFYLCWFWNFYYFKSIYIKMRLCQSAVFNPFNPLNAELNPICHLLALLWSATIVVVSRLRVNLSVIVLYVKNSVSLSSKCLSQHNIPTVLHVSASKALWDRLPKRVTWVGKIIIGKLGLGTRTDVGKYSSISRTIKSWNQLPAGLLSSFPCKLNTFRKRVKNVVTSKGNGVGIKCT